MDVDLSTDLDGFLPLVAPLISGHSDLAVGSRLIAGANVARGPRRETISRVYNLLLSVVFSTRIRDAQCGFKAIRSDVAAQLLPLVEDQAWFFDTELILLAERNGLRIHQVPVDWVEDLDSRVNVRRTAIEDLRGVRRMAWSFLSGRGAIDLTDGVSRAPADDLGRRFVSFAIVGVASTVVTLLTFLLLRGSLGSEWAVVVALSVTTAGNSWAHRRWTLGRRGGIGRHALVSAAVALAGIAASVVALSAVAAFGGGLLIELLSLSAVWGLTSLVRFALMSKAVR